jgi:ribosome biogenesis GTPase
VSDTSWWPEDGSPESERLQKLGWDQARDEEFAQLGEEGSVPGRIARVDRGICTVFAARGVHRAVLPPRFDTPAVGDWAAVRPAVPGGDDAVLRALMERRTAFTRQASGEETIGQVVASNIDVVFLVNSLDQRFSLRRLERYLTLGWQSGAQPVILLTKTDLCDETERFVLEAESIAFGTDVLAISAATGEGLEALDAHISCGRRTCGRTGAAGIRPRTAS